MRKCFCLLLLSLIWSGATTSYNIQVNTPVLASNEYGEDFKLAAELNTEQNHDLWRIQMGDNPVHISPSLITDDDNNNNKNELTDDELKENTNVRRHAKDDNSATEIRDFVGTNLFDSNRKKCFSAEDVALLSARRDFELLIPKDLPQSLLSDEMVGVLMQYFHSGSKIIKTTSDEDSKRLIEKAFYDTLGGYLRYYVVPVTKLSFYAGKVKLKTVENVVTLYNQCKSFLNTNGNGWRAPISNVLSELKNIHIDPLRVSNEKNGDEPSCCANLDLSSTNNDAEDEQMIVSLPKLDAEDVDGFLTNIWLPFKRRRTFNLRSSKAAFVVVKFYETVTRCYRFQKICQDTFNRKFKEWILENIQVHLSDEQLYPGLGAVLRIYENLRRGKKSVLLIDNKRVIEKINNEDYDDDIDSSQADNIDVDSDSGEETEDEDDIPLKQNQQRGGREDISSADEPKKKCKPKKKPKLKPKCQPKSSLKSKFQEFAKYFTSAKQKKMLKYIGYALALILLILLLILLICLCIKCIKKSKEKKKTDVKPDPKPSGAKKKGCIAFCLGLCRKKKSSDQEVLIKPNAKTVSVSKPAAMPSSTTSADCQPKPKCAKCCPIRGRKKSGPAVIETTSLDCTSSEAESVTTKKNKPKVLTINEKKKKQIVKSKLRKRINPTDSSDNSVDRKGCIKSPDNVMNKESDLSKSSKWSPYNTSLHETEASKNSTSLKSSDITYVLQSSRPSSTKEGNNDKSHHGTSTKTSLPANKSKNIRKKFTWQHIYHTLSDRKSSPRGRSKTSWETTFDS